MKRKIIFIAFAGLAVFCFFNTVYADTTVHLDIETSAGTLFNREITVSPCDSDNSGTMAITAYCAVLQSGLASDWSWFGSDAFLNSIDSTINNDNNNGIYWGWFANLDLGQTALNKYSLVDGDSILLTYNINPLKISLDNQNPPIASTVRFNVTQFGYDSFWNPVWNPAIGGKIVIESDIFDLESDGSYSFMVPNVNTFTVKGQLTGAIDTPQKTITTSSIQAGGGIVFSPSPSSSSFSSDPIQEKVKFDLGKAFNFIISQQKENGSFGEDLYTDWTAFALTGTTDFQNQKEKLIKYFREFKTKDYQLTDYERHAMALMAVELNPYDTNGENYIKKITDSFDGKQFGDVNEDNDDIFALIVLQNAGFTSTEKIISDDIAFVLSSQKRNGSWDESVDMTGAGIGALAFFNQNDQIKNALTKAKEFLKQNWKDNGGWGNNSSTAWAIEGILALSEKPEDWIKNENTPLDYLAINQDSDGGMKNDNIKNKLWETAYVTTALSGKTWNQIMQRFEKPAEIPVPQKTEEKTPKQATVEKNIAKNTTQKAKVLKPKDKLQKIEKLRPQNTATVINSIETKNPEPVKKSWFRNLLEKIFSIF